MQDDSGMAHDPIAADDSAAGQSQQSPAEAMTLDQLAEAKRYGQQKLAVSLAEKAIDLAAVTVFALVLAVPLDAWLAQRLPCATLRLLAFFGIMTLAMALCSWPLEFYSGFVLEHRFGLSRQSFLRWLGREAKEAVLALLLGALVVLGLFWLIWSTGSAWWMVSALAFFVVSVVLGQLAPVLILPLFYRVEPLADAALDERFKRLVSNTGLSIQGIYRLVLSAETAKANAMLAGLGRTRRVLLGDTLLEHFSADEIEVVFAHEVGHHVYRHIPKLIAAGFVISLLGFWLSDRALAAWIGSGYDPGQLPVFALPMVMLVFGAFGMLVLPLQNILSRYFERQCDRYALERTQLRDAYRSAFRKLARLNKDDPNPNRLATFLFHSHPPIAERLALADE
ncbi:MAG TPA: M48 family metallopeptidase [Pirellulales bacterium]|nr:M48 family metallopeptidase [Pirellulales bacterium]